jgi:hypothetical protein
MGILKRMFGVTPETELPPVWAGSMMHRLRTIELIVRATKEGMDRMDHNIDELVADIAAERTQVDSLVELTSGLKSKLAAALSSMTIPPDVQTKINAAFDQVEANKKVVMEAVNANTPAATVNPEQPGTPPPAG